ncbi:hypothetical protein DRN75_00300 [Nanoarchaeota archaeon]|nr:MAG: hypothetical protein DRN75_00300 [Nanoarchaeota archaeon]
MYKKVMYFPRTLNTGGIIKSRPEDFIVEEITEKVYPVKYTLTQRIWDSLPKIKKKYLHFTMVKRNYDTYRAIRRIAKALHVSRKRFSYAGNKDKLAVTSQRVSLYNGEIKQLKRLRLKDIILKEFQYKDRPLHIGELNGNRFTIVVRNAKRIDIDDIRSLRVPNYFGEQRFGQNARIGELIIKKKYKEAFQVLTNKKINKNMTVESTVINEVKRGKTYKEALMKTEMWRMFIHAYQSYIFNRTLERLIQMDYVPEKIPLVGKNTKLEGIVGEVIKNTMKDIKPTDIPEKGSLRETWMNIKWISIRYKGKDLHLKFELKKGQYATVLLSAITGNL